MNVLILNGSARGQKGVTGGLIKSFVDGLTDGAAGVVVVDVASLNVSVPAPTGIPKFSIRAIGGVCSAALAP